MTISLSELPADCFKCEREGTVLVQWPRARKVVFCEIHAVEAIALWFAKHVGYNVKTIRMTRIERDTQARRK